MSPRATRRRACALAGPLTALLALTGAAASSCSDPSAGSRTAGDGSLDSSAAASDRADGAGAAGDSSEESAEADGSNQGARTTSAPGTVADEDPTATTTPSEASAWTTSAVGRIPEGFPTNVPLPEGHRVEVVAQSTSGEPSSWMAQLVVPGDPVQVLDALGPAFTGTGWEELHRATERFGDSPTSSAVYSNDQLLVNIGAVPGAETGTAAVTYSIVPTGQVAEPAP